MKLKADGCVVARAAADCEWLQTSLWGNHFQGNETPSSLHTAAIIIFIYSRVVSHRGLLNHIHNFSSSPFRSRFEHQFGDAAEYLKGPGSLWHHTDPKEKNCEKVRVCSFGSDFEYLYVAWCTYLKLSRYLSWASSTGTGDLWQEVKESVFFSATYLNSAVTLFLQASL